MLTESWIVSPTGHATRDVWIASAVPRPAWTRRRPGVFLDRSGKVLVAVGLAQTTGGNASFAASEADRRARAEMMKVMEPQGGPTAAIDVGGVTIFETWISPTYGWAFSLATLTVLPDTPLAAVVAARSWERFDFAEVRAPK
jgi:hypothetical protein